MSDTNPTLKKLEALLEEEINNRVATELDEIIGQLITIRRQYGTFELPTAELPFVNCVVCGDSFKPSEKKIAIRTSTAYCSPDCQGKAQKKEFKEELESVRPPKPVTLEPQLLAPKPKKSMPDRVCTQCKKLFIPTSPVQKFCSVPCRDAYNNTTTPSVNQVTSTASATLHTCAQFNGQPLAASERCGLMICEAKYKQLHPEKDDIPKCKNCGSELKPLAKTLYCSVGCMREYALQHKDDGLGF